MPSVDDSLAKIWWENKVHWHYEDLLTSIDSGDLHYKFGDFNDGSEYYNIMVVKNTTPTALKLDFSYSNFWRQVSPTYRAVKQARDMAIEKEDDRNCEYYGMIEGCELNFPVSNRRTINLAPGES